MSALNLVSIGKACNLINGRAFKPSEWTTNGLPIIRIQNLNDEAKEFNYCDIEIERKYHIANGDLLFSWSGTPGTSFGAFFWNRGNALLNQHIFKVIIDENEIDKKYFRYALNSRLNQIIDQAHGGVGLKHITKGKLEAIQVPLPSIEEQQRIAAILDKADAIHRKRKKTIELADEFLRSVFLDMFGDPVTNPKGWPDYKLSEISEIKSGVTKGRKLDGKKTIDVPYMRVANVQDGHISLEDIKEIEALETDIDKYRLCNGDILLTEGGDPDKLGRGAVWKGEINPCIHQNHIFRVRTDESIILPEYLSKQIGSARGKRYFLASAKQTTGVASINMTQLKNFDTLVPPIQLQKDFCKIVGKYESLKNKLNEKLVEQNHLFNSLSQRAFRGDL